MSQSSAATGGGGGFVSQGFTRGLNTASVGLFFACACWTAVQAGTFLVLQKLCAYYEVGIATGAWSLIVATIGVATLAGISSGLGVRFGIRRMMLIGCAMQFIGAWICLFANSFELHLVGRGISVLGGANFTLAFAMTAIHWKGAAAKQAMGIAGAGAGFGAMVSFFCQGAIGQYVDGAGSWRYIFVQLIAFSAIAYLLISFSLKEGPREKIKIDSLGAVMLAAWLVLILVPLSQANGWGWGSARVIGMMLAGAAVLAAWVPFELWMGKRGVPFLDLRIMARPGVWQAALAYGSASWLAAVPGLLISYTGIPSHPIPGMDVSIGYGLGLSLMVMAIVYASSCEGSMVFAPIAGYMLGKGMRHKWILVWGMGIGGVFYAIWAGYHTSIWIWVVCLVLTGGLDYAYTAQGSIGQTLNHVAPHEAGVASGMLGVAGSCFSSIATALATYIVTTKDLLPGVPIPDDSRFTIIMIVAAGVGIVTMLLMLTIKRSAHVAVGEGLAEKASEATPVSESAQGA